MQPTSIYIQHPGGRARSIRVRASAPRVEETTVTRAGTAAAGVPCFNRHVDSGGRSFRSPPALAMSLVGDYGSSSDDDGSDHQQVDARAPAKLAGNSTGGNASDDSATDSDEEGSSSGSASAGENDSSDTDKEEERQAQRRKRQRSAAGAAASATAASGLGSVDDLFAATDTAILSSSNTTAFVAPSLDVAAEEKARAEAAAKARAAVAAAAPAAPAAPAKLAVPNAQFLRDIPGDPASKNATAKDWKTKEKLKRDRGQVSRFKNYVEEEKRMLREYEGNATAQS